MADNPLAAVATTLNAAGLNRLAVIDTTNHAVIVIDPDRTAGEPEIVLVTAHAALGEVVTVLRGQLGTSARSHARGTVWRHVSVKQDWDDVWAAIDDLGAAAAPADATYLVTTAHAGLSNELVVGATPGGELGNTWANPTVDATHGGSSHAAAIASAVAASAPIGATYLVATADGALTNEVVVGATPGGELGGTWAAPTVDSVHSGTAHHGQSHTDADHSDGANIKSAARKVVRKSADETVNNSAVLQNDDHLLFAIAASETWVGSFVVFHTGDSTADINLAVTVPSGATLLAEMMAAAPTTSAVQTWNGVTASGASLGTPGLIAATNSSVIYFSVGNGATPGNVQLQWAQAVATVANTTVKAGSHLVAERV